VVRGLTVHRSSRDRTQDPLLRNVSFDLPAGAVALLVGPNGSGKSTLLNALAGLHPRAEGHIEPGRQHRRRRGIGYAPQRGGELFVTASVRKEVGAILPRVDPLEAGSSDCDLDGKLDRAGLLSLADAHPQRLSGGQRQRLTTLLAMAGAPALLLLDEPTNAQDTRGSEQVLALIGHGVSQRIAVIATHEEELFAGLATHRIEMEAGTIRSVLDL
jgi:energy-coupling factor transporter ATP-binding protein EcfA2